jgi:hypothetical protein
VLLIFPDLTWVSHREHNIPLLKQKLQSCVFISWASVTRDIP